MQHYLRISGLALLVACGGSASTSPVVITGTQTFVELDGSQVTSNMDLTQTAVYAFSGDPLERYPATGTATVGADGTITIPDVPDGPFLLANGDTYSLYTDHDIHWYDTVLGRPDDAFGTAGTTLELQVDGLTTWSGGQVALVDDETGDALAMAGPTLGATSIDSTLAWTQLPLLDPAHGDAITFTSSTYPLANVAVVDQIATLVPTALQASGTNTVVTGSFAPPAMTTPAQLHADVAAATTTLAALGDAAAPWSWEVEVIAGPQTDLGWWTGTSLISMQGVGGSGVFDSGAQQIAIVDPWRPVAVSALSVGEKFGDFYLEAGISTGATFSGTLNLSTDAPIATQATAFGTSVENFAFTWDGKSDVPIELTVQGDATQIYAYLYDLTLDPTLHANTLLYFGTETSVILPAEVFVPGHQYVLDVTTRRLDDTTYDENDGFMPFGTFQMGS
ncbi:MAG TPA: hypothetical protein VGM88_04945 [Kofleriaceae bacterium]|jgi:hypothetical protein